MQNVMVSFISQVFTLVSDFLMSEPMIYFVGLFVTLFVVELIRRITLIGR